MTANMGTADRAIRALVGLFLLIAPFATDMALFSSSIVKYGAVIVGLVMLVTAATRVCPAYSIFGIKTCRT